MLACVLPDRVDVAVARRLLAVAPVVERDGDVVFLDVRGTSRLHGGARGVFEAVRAALGPERVRGLALASNRFTAEVAARHGVDVECFLELACGPGDHSLAMARAGIQVAALDRSEEMIAYLAERSASAGLEIDAVVGDMREARSDFERRFDLAATLIGSVDHLTTNFDFCEHLRAVARSLKPGGIYVVVDGVAYGPVGERGRIASDVSLRAEDVRTNMPQAAQGALQPEHAAGSQRRADAAPLARQ